MMFLKNVKNMHFMQYCATELAYCILDVMFLNSLNFRSSLLPTILGSKEAP
jgi:hypothetical protein